MLETWKPLCGSPAFKQIWLYIICHQNQINNLAREDNIQPRSRQHSIAVQSEVSGVHQPPTDGYYTPLHPSTRSWGINREQVNIIKIIGKGAFSKVARATVWNLRDEQEYTEVAAKMLKSELSISFSVITFLYIVTLKIWSNSWYCDWISPWWAFSWVPQWRSRLG